MAGGAHGDSRVTVLFRDSPTGQRLVGGSFLIVSEAGEDYTKAYNPDFECFQSYWAEENPADPDQPLVYLTPFGRYRVVPLAPPHFVGRDGTHELPEEAWFDFEPGRISEVVLECPRAAGAEGEADEPPQARAESAEEVRERLRKDSLYAVYVACFLLLAYVAAAVVFPALYFTVAGVAGTLRGGGPAFGYRLLEWYVGYGHVPNGLPAIAAYAGVWGIDAPALAICAALTVGGYLAAYWKAGSYCEDRVLTRSGLLDRMPERDESNIHGSAEIVRSMSRIRRELRTYNPKSGASRPRGPSRLVAAYEAVESRAPGPLRRWLQRNAGPLVRGAAAELGDAEIESSAFFVGYIDGPFQLIALERLAYPLRMACYGVKRLALRLRPRTDVWGQPVRIERPSMSDSMRYVYIDEFQHVMVLGSTGAGKTRRVLIPTILLYLKAGMSMVILDSKRELYPMVGDECKEAYGEDRVAVFDFSNPSNSKRINPMQLVIDAAHAKDGGVERRDEKGRLLGNYAMMTRRATDLAKQLIPETLDVGTAKFFNDGARAILKAVPCAVAADPFLCPEDEKSLATVAMVVDKYCRPVVDPKNANKSWVPFEKLLNMLPHDHPAVVAWGTCRSVKPEYLSSFCTTALGAIQDFRDREIKRMTSYSDLKFSEIGDAPSVVFLVIPQEKRTYDRIASMLIQQAYQALMEAAREPENAGKLKNRVVFLCEELGQVPAIPDLEKNLNICRGPGIQWILVFQSLAQIDTVYGRDYRPVLVDACKYRLFLQTGDVAETGKWVEEACGTYTAKQVTTQKNRAFLSPVPTSTSTTEAPAARPCLTAAEATEWSAGGEGGLVISSAGNGPWKVPLPDLSRTPAGEAVGINDAERIREKYMAASEAKEVPYSARIDWEPCLGERRDFDSIGEAEFRRIEWEFMQRLKASGTKDPDSDELKEGRPERRVPVSFKRDLEKERESPKAALVEYMQKAKLSLSFEPVGEDSGDSKARAVKVDGVLMGRGRGRTAAEAERNACARTLKSFAKWFELSEPKGKHAKGAERPPEGRQAPEPAPEPRPAGDANRVPSTAAPAPQAAPEPPEGEEGDGFGF